MQESKLTIKKERQRGVGIYITKPVYEAWLENLLVKDLVLALNPPLQEEFNTVPIGSRKDYMMIVIKMPSWWVEWYKGLSKEDKFRFARIVEKRLRQNSYLSGVWYED
jgi:hypothetical protein